MEETQAYVYFLLREGGEFLVKIRRGEETQTLIPWTPHPAIATWAGRAPEAAAAKNIIAVETEKGSLRFFVNEDEVASLPREGLQADGIVGLRVNHNVNIHVTTLDVRRKER